jgi:hypothetical protein
MAVVHGLEGDAAVIAVEVAVLHEVLDRIDNLEEGDGLSEWPFGWRVFDIQSRLTFFRILACSSRASNIAAPVSPRCRDSREENGGAEQ